MFMLRFCVVTYVCRTAAGATGELSAAIAVENRHGHLFGIFQLPLELIQLVAGHFADVCFGLVVAVVVGLLEWVFVWLA